MATIWVKEQDPAVAVNGHAKCGMEPWKIRETVENTKWGGEK